MRHLVDRIPGPRLGLRRRRGHEVDAPDSLSEYVLGWRNDHQPEQRDSAGFDDPVDVPDDADALDRLVAFTGRNPAQ